jgi:hypothetical protein
MTVSFFHKINNKGNPYFFNVQTLLMTFTGKSTHNQRIERLWRDVFQGCLYLFYDIFHALQRFGILDHENEVHLWCLHFIFLPDVNNHLQSWRQAWIHHPLTQFDPQILISDGMIKY